MRFEDWPERLFNFVRSVESAPFEWGIHDCCLFAAQAVEWITGVDHAADLRGTYSTAKEAARILKKRGGVRGIAGAALGFEIPPLTAQRGDVVLLPSEFGESLGVCLGHICVVPGPDGLTRLPITDAITAWRVV